jgi:hypothetical protein
MRHLGQNGCPRKESLPYPKWVYVNFLDDEREGQVQAAYGANYERLVALKNTYDPTNFFSLNQNIRPTVKGPRPLVQDWRIQAA